VCDDDNVASAKVIERCGGVLESVIDDGEGDGEGEGRLRRYWIHHHD
jgi:predicted acetyltransferase